MARQRGYHQGLTRTVRRKTSWEEGIGGIAAQTAVNGSGVKLAASAVALLVDGVTLVRTRGRLQIYLSSATAAFDGFAGAVGIGVATTAAVTAGAASVPSPITEQDWDGWLWWRAYQVFASGPIVAAAAALQTDAVNQQVAVVNIDIDSKAMRKVGIEDTIYFALESSLTGTAVAQWRVDSRMLFKLP